MQWRNRTRVDIRPPTMQDCLSLIVQPASGELCLAFFAARASDHEAHPKSQKAFSSPSKDCEGGP